MSPGYNVSDDEPLLDIEFIPLTEKYIKQHQDLQANRKRDLKKWKKERSKRESRAAAAAAAAQAQQQLAAQASAAAHAEREQKNQNATTTAVGSSNKTTVMSGFYIFSQVNAIVFNW